MLTNSRCQHLETFFLPFITVIKFIYLVGMTEIQNLNYNLASIMKFSKINGTN
jgi:hypothetical protein